MCEGFGPRVEQVDLMRTITFYSVTLRVSLSGFTVDSHGAYIDHTHSYAEVRGAAHIHCVSLVFLSLQDGAWHTSKFMN